MNDDLQGISAGSILSGMENIIHGERILVLSRRSISWPLLNALLWLVLAAAYTMGHMRWIMLPSIEKCSAFKDLLGPLRLLLLPSEPSCPSTIFQMSPTNHANGSEGWFEEIWRLKTSASMKCTNDFTALLDRWCPISEGYNCCSVYAITNWMKLLHFIICISVFCFGLLWTV